MDSKFGPTTDVKAEPVIKDGRSVSDIGRQQRDVKDGELDQAYWYLQEATSDHDRNAAYAEDTQILRRKIDWCIVPIMFCCYTMQFIDKVLLNVSS